MWDQRYDTELYLYGTEPNGFLVSVADRLPAAAEVLCLAEGEGRNSVYLAGRGHRVLAVDSSAVGLAKAQKLATARKVTLETRVEDLARLEIKPNGWDGIVSIFAHVPSAIRRELHRKVTAGLRPGGLFILEAYTPDQLRHKTGGPPDLDKLMNLDELRRELAGLTIEHGVETEREIVEGTLHTGLGAVVQILARKP